MKKSQKNKKSFLNILDLLNYIILICLYSIYFLLKGLSEKLKFLENFEKSFKTFIDKLDSNRKDSINKTALINLAIRNITSKRTRFLVTVGGMTIGIGGIVFLVSIGYGLQSLVVSRVARLEEMKQAEVTVIPGSNLVLNDETLKSFEEIPNVVLALPQIAVVGDINFNNSATDMPVYGVTSDYLKQSAISTKTGGIFDNNELTTTIKAENSNVEESNINNDLSPDSNLNGDFVEVEGESLNDTTFTTTKVKFPENLKDRNAVVNESFLTVLNISENQALNKKFSSSFISTYQSLNGDQNKIVSDPVEYTIAGVIPDDSTPFFYIPLIHLKSLGIENYSQIKVVANDEKNLADIRKEIEAKGFATSSVVDTVSEIDNIFSTFRILLALLGAVALLVAGLGMFNTLTVSLLERTREIGLLKAMGMQPEEIRDLFLAESMIMGFLGGLLGLIVGLILGKFLELILSIYSLLNSGDLISITNMPILFTISIILISFFVGVLTGIYPAKRATKISALNALRYE